MISIAFGFGEDFFPICVNTHDAVCFKNVKSS